MPLASIALYWRAMDASQEPCLQTLVDSGLFDCASEPKADICIYGLAATQPAFRQDALVVAEQTDLKQINPAIDFCLPAHASPALLRHVLQQASRQVQLKRQLQQQQAQQQQLTDIGLALSAEQDHHKLLQQILTAARHFGQCDAASIFLVDESSNPAQLVFKLTQNDSLAINFTEQHFPLDDTSLAGHCVLSGKTLNLEDAYRIPSQLGLHFNREFDQRTGYRTRSMLVIPMRGHEGRIIGVIQFINRKRHDVALTSAELTLCHTQAFDETMLPTLHSLVSQAAVAIENNLLLERIHQLFEGFVSASVRAIEQRDPTTSGHSFRVAELTSALAEAAHQHNQGELQALRFSHKQLRELRYAALLHDFGKVGVREHVLVKSKKLTPLQTIKFQYRLALQREHIRSRYLRRQLMLQQLHQLDADAEQQLHDDEQQELARLEQIRELVEAANEPSVLDEETLQHLGQLRDTRFIDLGDEPGPLFSEQEFLALAVKRGSLTEGERSEIENHVTHTIRFLQTIPWTPELQNIPIIAGAHHEKLDGSGYPNQLSADAIPPGARIMTICDIFDALTASDRPYKPALPVSRALDILGYDASAGKIDLPLYQLFCRLSHSHIIASLKNL